MTSGKQQTSGILNPHEHDVLSGRGNFVNYHAGNEHFRALVRKHKLEYVKCPKPQKGKFSRMIVDEIKNRNPPGRFLKQDGATKLWYDIGEKKALDKTRQALREGAPEIVKEMTGGSDDDSDAEGVGIVQKDALNVMGGGNRFGGDVLNHPFLSSGMQSPVMTRGNFQLNSPSLTSPHLMSPGMLLGSQLSPDMGLSGGKIPQVLSSIPAPQVHQQLDQASLNQMNHQLMMSAMANQQAGGMGGGNILNSQMNQQMNQQMINQQMNQQMNEQLNQQMTQQLINQQMNQQMQQQMNQQFNQQLNQIKEQGGAQDDFAEYQMLQNRLNAIYANNDQLNPSSLGGRQSSGGGASGAGAGGNNNNGNMLPPRAANEAPKMKSTGLGLLASTKVDTLPGNNPRRMPPPSLMKREDSSGSIKVDTVFSASSPSGHSRRKYDGSVNHLSAMSLSMGDLNEEDNLSSVFDSSLQIKDSVAKEKVKDRSSNNWDGPALDMSVATLGGGNMSIATLGEPKLNEADEEGNMSFGNVFEDPHKE